MYIVTWTTLKDTMHVVNWTSIRNTHVVMKDWKPLHTKHQQGINYLVLKCVKSSWLVSNAKHSYYRNRKSVFPEARGTVVIVEKHIWIKPMWSKTDANNISAHNHIALHFYNKTYHPTSKLFVKLLPKQFALLPVYGLQNHEIVLTSVPDSWASNACCLVASLVLISYLSPA